MPPASSEELFEVFWRAYPRRVAKGEARKAWQKLKPAPELVARMLEALAWQRESDQWQKDDGQYIPHPSTWLRAERWEDEPPDVGRVSSGKAGYSISEAKAALEALDVLDGLPPASGLRRVR